MVSLTNPVNLANVVLRFEDIVAADARGSIVYHTGGRHFPQAPSQFYGGGSLFGGTSGPPANSYLSSANLGSTGGTITASTVRSAMISATSSWTHLRNAIGRYYLQNQQFNQYPNDPRSYQTGPVGTNYGKTWMTTNSQGQSNYSQFVGYNRWDGSDWTPDLRYPQETISTPAATGVESGDTINSSNLEAYMSRCRTNYQSIETIGLHMITTICHYSCFTSSCHFSRGRR